MAKLKVRIDANEGGFKVTAYLNDALRAKLDQAVLDRKRTDRSATASRIIREALIEYLEKAPRAGR